MFLRILIVILGLIIIGCGQEGEVDIEYIYDSQVAPVYDATVNPVFKPFIKEWEEHYKQKTVSIVFFSDFYLEESFESAVGLCRKFADGWREVHINKMKWDFYYSFEQQWVLIMHELNHCELDIPHSDKEGTVMYPHMPNVAQADLLYANKQYD